MESRSKKIKIEPVLLHFISPFPFPFIKNGQSSSVAAEKKKKAKKKHQPMGLDILYEDRDIIVVSKAAGLLTMGTGRDGGRTAHAALDDYVKKGNYKSYERIFIVHRLDRDTSGALVFARSEKAKLTLQKNWEKAEKTYLAFVEGHPDPASGTIESYLAENDARRVFSTNDSRKGKLSTTRYQTLKQVGKRTLLEITLLTGRKNQIRVHLADKGWPIVGDSKYGKKIRDNKRLALHSHILSFDHPYSGKRMTFTSPAPATFHKMAAAPEPEPAKTQKKKDDKSAPEQRDAPARKRPPRFSHKRKKK